MALDKVYKMHPTFEEWVGSHRHSSASVECALRRALDGEPDSPIDGLKSYISSLGELRDEIRVEIDVARYWIRYFRSHKGDLHE